MKSAGVVGAIAGFVAFVALVAGLLSISERERPRRSGQSVEHAVVLGSSELGLPFAFVCNAVRVDGVVSTATHCVDQRDASIHVGGASICSDDEWERLPAQVLLDRGDDLSSTSPVQWRERSSVDSVGHGDAVQVIGFGPEGGRGSATCALQTFDATVVPARECGESDAPHQLLCLTGVGLCPGFSGSAVVSGGRVVGVVSRGTSCWQRDGFVVARPLWTSTSEE